MSYTGEPLPDPTLHETNVQLYQSFCSALTMDKSPEGVETHKMALTAPSCVHTRIATAIRNVRKLMTQTDPLSQFQLLMLINTQCHLRKPGRSVGPDDRIPVFIAIMHATNAIEGYAAVLDYLDAALGEELCDKNALESLKIQLEITRELTTSKQTSNS